MDEGTVPDFFISYTESDAAWAQWIAVTLEDAGYRTVSQVLDMLPGNDFTHVMHRAAATARRTIAVLSPAYLESPFGEAEWRVAFRADPTGERALVVPIMVESCRPIGLLSTRIHIDLVGLDEATARTRLLAGLAPQPRPTTADFPRPASPGTVTGTGLSISNLPARNRSFAGRADALQDLHRRMATSGIAAVVPFVSVAAVHGLGGVGKSELAIEYAHRHGADYDVRWWIPAEDPAAATAALARLATRLGIPTDTDDAGLIERLFDQLQNRSRWLLIYDNAEQPEYLDGLLPPAGTGHVIVTSRWAMWGRVADSVGLQVLRREESVEFFRRRLARGDSLAVELAELLGDLPLALEEAAAYLEATSTGLAEYLDLVRKRARELFGLSSRRPDTDRRRVATVWSLSLDRLRDEAPEAEHLLILIAFLAPDVPRELPTLAAKQLPVGLAAAVSDPISYHALLAAMARYSVASVGLRTIGLHRLVAEVVRARLDPAQERAWAMTSVALLRAAYPSDGDEQGLRTELLPHIATAVGHAQRLQVGAKQTRRLLEQATGHAEQSNLGRLDALAAAAARGDRAALEMFLAEAERLVRRIVVAQLGSFGNVDDTVQDALVAIVRSLEDGKLGDRPAVAFVAQVTRVVVDDAWSRVAADLEQPTREFPDLADPSPEPGQSIESMDIHKALDDLPPHERSVIVLRVVEGLSDIETAAVLGTSRASVRVTQHRALERLRTLLQQ